MNEIIDLDLILLQCSMEFKSVFFSEGPKGLVVDSNITAGKNCFIETDGLRLT